MKRELEVLGGAVSDAAAVLPVTQQQREAVVAVSLHAKLQRCRVASIVRSSDACVLDLLSEADRMPWEALVSEVDGRLAALDLELSNEAQFLLRLFFRMVHAVRARGARARGASTSR